LSKSKTGSVTVYLALARFRKRPAISVLPVGLQRDIREFFGSYKNACEQADPRRTGECVPYGPFSWPATPL